MRYRLETEGGTMTMESRPGAGTLIRAVLPESTEPTEGETPSVPSYSG